MEYVSLLQVSRYYNPVFDEDKIYLITGTNMLVCYDIKMKTDIYSVSLQEKEPFNQPLWSLQIAGDYLLVPSREYSIIFEKKTGKLICKHVYESNRLVLASIMDNGTIFSVFPDGDINVVNIFKEILWQKNLKTPVYRWGFIVDMQTVYVGQKKSVTALDIATGKVQWSQTTKEPLLLRSSLLKCNDILYFVDGKYLVCVEKGACRRSDVTESAAETTLKVAAVKGNFVFVWTEKKVGKGGRVYILLCYDINNQTVRWRRELTRYRDEDFPLFSLTNDVIALSVGSLIVFIDKDNREIRHFEKDHIIVHTFIDNNLLACLTTKGLALIVVQQNTDTIASVLMPDVDKSLEVPIEKGVLSKLMQEVQKRGGENSEIQEMISFVKDVLPAKKKVRTLSNKMKKSFMKFIK